MCLCCDVTLQTFSASMFGKVATERKSARQAVPSLVNLSFFSERTFDGCGASATGGELCLDEVLEAKSDAMGEDADIVWCRKFLTFCENRNMRLCASIHSNLSFNVSPKYRPLRPQQTSEEDGNGRICAMPVWSNRTDPSPHPPNLPPLWGSQNSSVAYRSSCQPKALGVWRRPTEIDQFRWPDRTIDLAQSKKIKRRRSFNYKIIKTITTHGSIYINFVTRIKKDQKTRLDLSTQTLISRGFAAFFFFSFCFRHLAYEAVSTVTDDLKE